MILLQKSLTKTIQIIYLGLAFFILFSNEVNGQRLELETDDLTIGSFDLMEDLMTQLISLDDIIEIGLQFSPNIKRNAALTDSEKERLIIQKKLWSTHIQTFANYSFGNQGILIAGSTESNINTIANGYRFGLNVSIPFYEFYTRGNRVKLAKAELAAAENMKNAIELEVKQEIISAYFRVISTQKSMVNNHEFLNKALISERIGELKFKENQISITDYTRLSEISSLARERYNNAYADFLSAYKNLEALLGIELYFLKR
ncbi:TolC family protein [Mongoliitalea daihaiensis]|uniref:TolC family protein n=1 Tax=Mongoliitalea daihaiensis TaxID=2782006 RepID=UPI001F26A652|nr:TolC family protein [Mongoliitalea daihaiensis]